MREDYECDVCMCCRMLVIRGECACDVYHYCVCGACAYAGCVNCVCGLCVCCVCELVGMGVTSYMIGERVHVCMCGVCWLCVWYTYVGCTWSV